MTELCTCEETLEGGCACAFRSGTGIEVAGAGKVAAPLAFTPTLDSDPDNLAELAVDGILVRLPEAIRNPPRAEIYHNAAQSLPNRGHRSLSFNSERYDTDTMHDTVTGNSRITIRTPGIYLLTAQVAWAGNATGDRWIYFYKNSRDILGGSARRPPSSASFECAMQIATQAYLDADEYVQVVGRQDSGGALNVNATRYSPVFSATWLRREPPT